MIDDPDTIQANLRLHVDRLAGLIGPRVLTRPGSIEPTLGYLRGQWREMDWQISEETYDALGEQATNLCVQQPGTHSPDQVVLLGAHYDTTLGTPGADDNASAVAVMLEVSRILRHHNARRTARYVAFACEEAPYFNLDLMGSQHHARLTRQRNESVVGMLCLEMVGYFIDDKGSQKIPPTIPKVLHPLFPKRGNFLAAVGNLASWRLCWKFRRGFKRGTKLPLFSIALPESVREIRLSDNRAFWDQNYPALMLTDTSFLRNPNYHMESDTPETLDYERMTQVTLGVVAAMKHLLR